MSERQYVIRWRDPSLCDEPNTTHVCNERGDWGRQRESLRFPTRTAARALCILVWGGVCGDDNPSKKWLKDYGPVIVRVRRKPRGWLVKWYRDEDPKSDYLGRVPFGVWMWGPAELATVFRERAEAFKEARPLTRWRVRRVIRVVRKRPVKPCP